MYFIKHIKLKLNPNSLHTAKTPSYPSGHALRGRFIGRYLSEKYPEYKSKLMELGDELGVKVTNVETQLTVNANYRHVLIEY